MKRILFLSLIMVCALNANAQTYLDHLQQDEAGKGKVTVHESSEIDKLVNGEEKPAPKKETARQDKKEKKNIEQAQAQQQNTVQEENTEDTSAITRTARKMKGYRVQVFAGGNSGADKAKANSIGDAIRTRFPGHTVYVNFVSPRWICRMGNFKTKEEAQEMLSRVKAAGYVQACLVKGTITVFE